MAAPFKIPQQVHCALTDGGKQDVVLRNDFTANDRNIDLNLDLLQLNSDETLQISHPIHLEPNGPLRLLVESQEDGENLQRAGPSGNNVPRVSVMRCINCCQLVLSLKFNPQCPSCKNSDLIDLLKEKKHNLP